MLSYDFSMLVLLTLFCANLIVNLSIVYLFFMGFILLGLDFKLVKICSRQELWQLDQAGKIHVSSMWGFEIQLCQVVGDWLAGRPRRDFLFILALQIILIVDHFGLSGREEVFLLGSLVFLFDYTSDVILYLHPLLPY